jgi:methylated-DNA-[protein]-cysteine S-methyltransferase
MMQSMASAYIYDAVMDSDLGRLGICCRDNRVSRLEYVPSKVPLKAPATALARQVTSQLARFFSHPGHHFTLALDLQGTAFQCRVWEALTRIVAGQTLTYGELAASLGSGARAVGNACRQNPIPIIVPCHRVIGATGIGGYSGSTDGLEVQRKQWLLNHEGITIPPLKICSKSPTKGHIQVKQRNLHA